MSDLIENEKGEMILDNRKNKKVNPKKIIKNTEKRKINNLMTNDKTLRLFESKKGNEAFISALMLVEIRNLLQDIRNILKEK